MKAIKNQPVETPEPLEEAVAALLAQPSEADWTRFVALAHPLAVSICRRRRLRPAISPGDDLHGDTALRAVELVRARDFAALRRFADARSRYPQLAFAAWFATLVTHAHIDIVREHPTAQRRRTGEGRRLEIARRLDGDDASDAIESSRAPALGIERVIELRRVCATLARRDFPADQRQALSLWLDGHRADEIADILGLASKREADQLLRAARQRLRRLHLGVR